MRFKFWKLNIQNRIESREILDLGTWALLRLRMVEIPENCFYPGATPNQGTPEANERHLPCSSR